MCQQQNIFEHRQLVAGYFVQMETLAAPELSILSFAPQEGGGGLHFVFLLEIKVFGACDWCSFIKRCSALIHFDLVCPAAKCKSRCVFCFFFSVLSIFELTHVGPAHVFVNKRKSLNRIISQSFTDEPQFAFLWETSCSIPCYCTHGIPLRCVICLQAMQREWDPCIMIQKRGIGGKTMRRMDCGCCVGSAETTEGC